MAATDVMTRRPPFNSDLPPMWPFAGMEIGIGLQMLLAQSVKTASPGKGRNGAALRIGTLLYLSFIIFLTSSRCSVPR